MAVRADTVSEIGLRMVPDINLQPLPGPVIVADFFAGGANWQQPMQNPQLLQGLLVLAEGLVAAEMKYRELVDELDGTEADGPRHIARVARVCGLKVGLSQRLAAGYAAKDFPALTAVRGEISACIESIEMLAESFRSYWLARNKPFGLEVLQIRLAGNGQRYRELDRRLEELLDGRIERIEELDGNCPEAPGGEVPQNYKNLATGSCIL